MNNYAMYLWSAFILTGCILLWNLIYVLLEAHQARRYQMHHEHSS